jgi:hypothetical protein
MYQYDSAGLKFSAHELHCGGFIRYSPLFFDPAYRSAKSLFSFDVWQFHIYIYRTTHKDSPVDS